MRKAFLIKNAQYVATYNTTVFNWSGHWDGEVFYVKGDLTDKYKPGSIAVFASTKKFVPAATVGGISYYWKEVTE